VKIYEQLYALCRLAYFSLGTRKASAAELGGILPELRRIASEVSLTCHLRLEAADPVVIF